MTSTDFKTLIRMGAGRFTLTTEGFNGDLTRASKHDLTIAAELVAKNHGITGHRTALPKLPSTATRM